MIYRSIVRFLEGLIIIAMAALVLDVLWGVVSRVLGTFRAWLYEAHQFHAFFLPAGQSSWTEELARFLLIWVGLLGGALAFGKSGHLGMDYLVGKLHPDVRRWVRIFGCLTVIFFAVAILCVGGWSLMQRTLEMGQQTPALGIQKGWVYLAVPLSGVFTLFFSITNLLRAWKGEQDSEETANGEIIS